VETGKARLSWAADLEVLPNDKVPTSRSKGKISNMARNNARGRRSTKKAIGISRTKRGKNERSRRAGEERTKSSCNHHERPIQGGEGETIGCMKRKPTGKILAPE